MNLSKYLDISPEVAEALAAGKPVVALESTIISHGMPYPQNVETALAVENIVRENGAVPATIAIIGGRLKAGCTKERASNNRCCVRFTPTPATKPSVGRKRPNSTRSVSRS